MSTPVNLTLSRSVRRGDTWPGVLVVWAKAGLDFTGATVACTLKADPSGSVIHTFTLTPNVATVGECRVQPSLTAAASAGLPAALLYGDVILTHPSLGTLTAVTFALTVLEWGSPVAGDPGVAEIAVDLAVTPTPVNVTLHEAIGVPVGGNPDDVLTRTGPNPADVEFRPVGGSVQPLDATLTALAALATGADKLAYSTGTDTFAQTDLTAAGRALLDDADNTAQRTTLGLGNAATKNVGTASTDVAAGDAAANAIAAHVAGLDPHPVYATAAEAAAAAPVQSVAGRTGAVVLAHSDISGLGNAATKNVGTGGADVAAGNAPAANVATHESAYAHANLPSTTQKAALAGTSGTPGAGNPYVTDADPRNTNARTPAAHTHAIADTTGLQAALDLLAPLASPTFTGVPAVPTAGPGTNTTQSASTAFVQAAVSLAVTGLLEFKGSLDCSANPDYPAADKGDTYYVNVAGKVGGASGVTVAVGDAVIAKADNAGGSEASVGTSWFVLEKNLQGALLAANNLSDLTDAAAARGNLGLGTLATQNGTFSGTSSGTNTGDQTITLTGDATGTGTGSFAVTIANGAVTYAKIQNVSATDKLLGRSTSGAGPVEEITCTAAGRALLDDADATAQRTTLGLAAIAETGSAADLSGTVATARLGSGTADSTTYLRGDQTWATVVAGIGGSTGSVDNSLLRSDGTGGATVQNSSVQVDDFTASTQANVALKVDDGSTANIAFVAQPKGTGAFLLGPKPDNTGTGGNARGVRAVDLQLYKIAANEVASGIESIVLGGTRNSATSDQCIAGGAVSVASGIYASVALGYAATSSGGFGSTAIGYATTASGSLGSFAHGRSTTASGQNGSRAGGYGSVASADSSIAEGIYASATKLGEWSLASGRTTTTGDAQISEFVLRNTTTSTTPTDLFLDGVSDAPDMENNTIWQADVMVTGTTAAGAAVNSYRFDVVIIRGASAASTTLKVATKTVVYEDDAGADAAITASASGYPVTTVTAANATSTHWVAVWRVLQVKK